MSQQDKKKLAELLQELKKDYLKKLPAHIEKLYKLTSERDWPLLEEEYHKLKGTGKTYGFTDISVVCEKLESLAKKKEDKYWEIFNQGVLLLDEMNQNYQLQKTLEINNHPLFLSISKLG